MQELEEASTPGGPRFRGVLCLAYVVGFLAMLNGALGGATAATRCLAYRPPDSCLAAVHQSALVSGFVGLVVIALGHLAVAWLRRPAPDVWAKDGSIGDAELRTFDAARLALYLAYCAAGALFILGMVTGGLMHGACATRITCALSPAQMGYAFWVGGAVLPPIAHAARWYSQLTPRRA